MRMLIRIVFVIFIAKGIDCLGGVCDDCCDCFEEKDKNEEIKEYEEIKDKNNIAKSLVNWFWFDDKEKNKENDLVLKIFKKKDDKVFPSKDNGDKISIKLEENNNPKIAYQKGAEDEPNLQGKKYALFEIETKKGKTVYLYCSDVESSRNSDGIFQDTNYVSISVIACDTEKVKNMGSMFSRCNSLTKLDLKNFNTKNVTNMKYMFCGCENLKKLNIENFNTKNVTNMGYMFHNCSSLKDLNIKNFNTENVTNMEYMFYKCSMLKDLEFGVNFNTENVTDMSYMFGKCSNLTKLELNNFDTTNVSNMWGMFCKCSSLKNLEIGKNFDPSKVKNKENMFDGCKKLPNDTINNILNKINNPQINY